MSHPKEPTGRVKYLGSFLAQIERDVRRRVGQPTRARHHEQTVRRELASDPVQVVLADRGEVSVDDRGLGARKQLDPRRELGRPMSAFDGQIAAIAKTQGFAIATRNIKDFDDCGLQLINPFSPG